ncbi:MAG: DUF1127 domain-containing protein [Marinibacterium sp.]
MTTLTRRQSAFARLPLPFGLGDYLALWRQRQHLARLDDIALKDLGLTRHQAESEAARPFWDVPAHWRR